MKRSPISDLRSHLAAGGRLERREGESTSISTRARRPSVRSTEFTIPAGDRRPSGQAGDSVKVNAPSGKRPGLVAGRREDRGVPAGIVNSVDLTDGRLALVEIGGGLALRAVPGRRRCQVRSQSLIGERFIQCDPGTIDAGALAAGADGTPTVPVAQDTAPIDLDLLFDVFRAPIASGWRSS